jgi:hypothetical protein
MYKSQPLPKLVEDFTHHVVVARKAAGNGHLDMSAHLVAASVDMLDIILERVADKAACTPGSSSLELNIPESAGWSREQFDHDQARLARAKLGTP